MVESAQDPLLVGHMLISLHKSLQLFASSSAPHSGVMMQRSDSYYSLSGDYDGHSSSLICRFPKGAQHADEGDVSSTAEVLSVAGTGAADCRHALLSERRRRASPTTRPVRCAYKRWNSACGSLSLGPPFVVCIITEICYYIHNEMLT